MNAEQKAMQTLLADPAGLKAYITAGETVNAACKAHVDAIRRKVEAANDAKNAADTGKTVKAGIWAETLAVVGIIADATKDAKGAKWREQLFTDVMGDFLSVAEGEKPSTAKAYASTGRAVLVKLLPRMSLDDVKAKSYADVRKLVSPPKNPEADGILKRMTEQLRYIGKNADKHGGTKAVARLEELAEYVADHYNAVKTAKDSKSSASKAAKELDANRQQRPDEPTTTETVQRPEADGKPEAPALQATG